MEHEPRVAGQGSPATRVVPALFLSFGPMLIVGLSGLWMATRRNAPYADIFGVIVAVSMLFYFFVDVKDHQHVYVGWRSGHFMFVAFAGLVGYALQELFRMKQRTRVAALVVVVILALAAAPTTAIDFYNTQDVANRALGPLPPPTATQEALAKGNFGARLPMVVTELRGYAERHGYTLAAVYGSQYCDFHYIWVR